MPLNVYRRGVRGGGGLQDCSGGCQQTKFVLVCLEQSGGAQVPYERGREVG